VGDQLSVLWRQRQLEYTWTRSRMKRYVDFWTITEEALDYALETFSLHEKPGLKQALIKSYLERGAYPDAAGVVEQIKTLGYRTAVLSNGTLHMLLQAMQADDLLRHIDLCLSVDERKIYKPDPAVYRYACERLNTSPGQVCFFSSNVWDLAGAAAVGFHVVRVNR
jgi:2-haloacid dehalogenase